MPELTVGSWEEFEAQLADLKKRHIQSLEGLCFRGLSDAEWPLKTTLERRMQSSHLLNEKSGNSPLSLSSVRKYYELISEVQPQIEAFTDRKWISSDDARKIWELCDRPDWFREYLRNGKPPAREYLVYLRHHGFPSPLLDWTRSPYVAAYFAFREPSVSKNAAIYVFSEAPNNEKFRLSSSSSIYVVGPNIAAHRRHFLQQATYTVCVIDNPTKQDLSFASHEAVFNREQGQDELWKITIPSTERIKVLRILDEHNLNSFSMFGSEESLMETMAIRGIDFASD
jgi:hypothetical protein